MQDAKGLLDAIFEGKPESDRILVWVLPGRRSRWFKTTKTIPKSTVSVNTYFGVGAVNAGSAKEAGEYKRSSKDTVSGIGALWLDVDIAGPAHQKKNLPIDYTEAIALVNSAFPRYEPSYIIDSGHGIQVYFLLNKWLEINDNRPQVIATLEAFSAHWKTYCKSRGFDADSVFDLARVMRLPGSMNVKIADDVKPVTEIKSRADIRYSFESFTKDFPLLTKPSSRRKETASGEKSIIPSTLDPDRLEAFLDVDIGIRLSYNHNKDLPSPSEYDLSLARYALNAGWSTEDTYQLLVSCRNKNKSELKPSAMRGTIQKVVREIQEAAGGLIPEDGVTESKEKMFSRLQYCLAINISKITRYTTTPPAYVLMMADDQIIHLGTIESITEQKRFRNAVAASIGALPTKLKGDAWDKAAALILKCADDVTAGTEATEEGACFEWIQAYLHEVTIHKEKDDGLQAGEPFVEDEHVHLTSTALRTWVSVHLGDRVDARRLGIVLKMLKAEPCTVINNDHMRSAWRIPRSIWTPR